MKPKIIVSLTSFPARINDIHIVIESLMNQSVKPDKIILFLTSNEFPDKQLPDNLTNLQNDMFEIRWTDCNYRSYNKLVHTLADFPNDIIITVDDDVLYPRHLVKDLIKLHKKHPNDICAHRIRTMNIQDGVIQPYNTWKLLEKRGWFTKIKPGYTNFFCGVGGVLYPPKALYKDVLNNELFTELCKHQDDVWFWGMAVLNNRKIFVTRRGFDVYHRTIKKLQSVGLWQTINSTETSPNNIAVDNMIEKYPQLGKYIGVYHNIKVSVVVPVYNVESYLPQCLDSLLAQTLHEIEIICVNDGSTDKSLDVLNEYSKKDSRIVVVSQENRGLGGARNTGMRFARGEYVGFVDSDDWVAPDYFEKLYNAAKNNNADMARTQRLQCFPDGTTNNEPFNKTIKKRAKNDQNLAVNEHAVVVWDAIYRNLFLGENNISFVEPLIHEDIPFTAKATFLANKIVPVADTFYYYRVNRPQALSNKSVREYMETLRANHIALTFMNSVKYKKKADYIQAVSRCFWRGHHKFMSMLECDEFTPEIQQQAFNMMVEDYKNIKFKKKISKISKYNDALFMGDFDKFKS